MLRFESVLLAVPPIEHYQEPEERRQVTAELETYLVENLLLQSFR